MCSCGCELAMAMARKYLDAEADARDNQLTLPGARSGGSALRSWPGCLARLIACFVPEWRAAR